LEAEFMGQNESPDEHRPYRGGYWTLRERFEQGEIDIDLDDDKLAAQLGSIKWGIDSVAGSRSNRRMTCANGTAVTG
jgi:hypothetical protein